MKVKFLLFVFMFLFLASGANAAWEVRERIDEMTQSKSYYSSSGPVKSTRMMDFPYNDITASLGVSCDDNGKKWVSIFFSNSPNLIDTSYIEGYSYFTTRIKWDDNIEYVELNQLGMSKILRFSDNVRAIYNVSNSDSALLELNWYAEEDVYFRFDLEGAEAALNEMFMKCDVAAD